MLKVMTIVRTRPELTNLDVEQIKTLLLKLDYIKEELNA